MSSLRSSADGGREEWMKDRRYPAVRGVHARLAMSDGGVARTATVSRAGRERNFYGRLISVHFYRASPAVGPTGRSAPRQQPLDERAAFGELAFRDELVGLVRLVDRARADHHRR